MPPITGLETYAIPLLYATGGTTAIATWLTVARFRMSMELATPIVASMVALAIGFAGTVMIGIGFFGATLMDPKTNHFPIAGGLWIAATLAPMLFCAKPTK